MGCEVMWWEVMGSDGMGCVVMGWDGMCGDGMGGDDTHTHTTHTQTHSNTHTNTLKHTHRPVTVYHGSSRSVARVPSLALMASSPAE